MVTVMAVIKPGLAPFLEIGVRVSARYAIDPKENDGYRVSDALGYIVDADNESITVETKRGLIKIQREIIVAAKVVPPPPKRPVKRSDS